MGFWRGCESRYIHLIFTTWLSDHAPVKKSGRPRRPRSHVVGNEAQLAVAKLLTSWTWTADFIHCDYGEDVECNIFVDGQRTNFYFRVQVKGTASGEHGMSRYANGDFRVTISGELCRQWYAEFFPVILAVYDKVAGGIFWFDPVAHLKDRPALLGRNNVTFRVARDRSLDHDKDEIARVVEGFYARLLKLEQHVTECTVYPILMPGYRSQPINQTFRSKKIAAENATLEIESHWVSIDHLPGWLTPVKSLRPGLLNGYLVSSRNLDIDQFFNALRRLLAAKAKRTGDNSWLAFVISPLRLGSNDANRAGTEMLTREITDWQSYSLVSEETLVRDVEHAFKIPQGYIRTIGRRARSWDGNFFVDVNLDLAVEFFAPSTPKPSDWAKTELYKANIEAQLLPWICPVSEVEALHSALSRAELVFHETPDVKCAPNEVAGVITLPLTNPRLGMFSMMMAWQDFELGAIKSSLAEHGVGSLPGREGGLESWDVLRKIFSHLHKPPPKEIYVGALEHDQGLPLNLGGRMIEISRFRRKTTFSQGKSDCRGMKERLSRMVSSVGNLESFSNKPIDWTFGKIARLSVAVKPKLELSSKACLEQICNAVAAEFDTVLPRPALESSDSLSTLHLDGELYFEGDERFLVRW